MGELFHRIELSVSQCRKKEIDILAANGYRSSCVWVESPSVSVWGFMPQPQSLFY